MAFRLGTSEFGGTFHTQGLAIAELFNRGRAESERLTVHASDAASVENAKLLDRGELEVGFMASNWVGRARQGASPFARAIEIRMVAPANVGPIFFVTLAGSPIRTIRDFSGKRIALGLRGSGMVEHARTIFGVLGMPFERFTPLYLGFSEGARALRAGEVDVQFQPPAPNRVMTDLSESAEVRVVPYAPGDLERVLAAVSFYRRAAVRKGAFRGVSEDVPQAGVVNVLVSHARVAPEPIYLLAKRLLENLDELPRLNPLFEGLRELFESFRSRGIGALERGAPLHPGAFRAYREAGWGI